MTRYKNLEFYFYVFIVFFAFLIYRPIPVHAETEKDVNIHVKDVSQVFDYEKFYFSNFSRVSDGNVDGAIVSFDNRQITLSSNCDTNGRVPCPYVNFEDGDISSSGSIKRSMLMDIGTQGYPDFAYGGQGNKYLLQQKFWIRNTYNHLDFNTPYQIAFKIQKDSGLSFNLPDVNIGNYVHLEITDNDNPINTINVDDIVTKSARMIRVDDNHAFIIINFEFDNSEHVYTFSNFSLNNVFINLIALEESYSNSNYPLISKQITPVHLQNGISSILSNGYEHPYHFKIASFYFLKDGFVSFDGSYLQLDGTYSDNISAEYETLTESDIGAYDPDYYCQPADIVCHLNNIIRNIKNVFIRIGKTIEKVIEKIVDLINSIFTAIVNALKSLFIPSDNFINTFFSNQYQLISDKLGILLSPFTIIANILNRFISVQPNHIISFSGFTLPIFNKLLIPSFTFDFVDFFNSKPEIAQMYDYYKIGVVAIIYIMFLSLCYKKFKSLIGGDTA